MLIILLIAFMGALTLTALVGFNYHQAKKLRLTRMLRQAQKLSEERGVQVILKV